MWPTGAVFYKDRCRFGSYFRCWPLGKGSWEQSMETRVGQVSCKGQWEWQCLRWKHQFIFLTYFSLAFCLFVFKIWINLFGPHGFHECSLQLARGTSVPWTAYAWSTPCIPAAYFEFHCLSLLIFGSILFFFFCLHFGFCFCYIFFCILAKLRLALHGASSSTHSRALVDKKLQISIRKARSLQDRMQQQQSSQPPSQPSACLPSQGGALPQPTR